MFALEDNYGITLFGIVLLAGFLLVFLFVMILGPLFAVGIVSTYYSCASYAELNQEYEVHWDFWNGCMVKNTQGLWINKYQIDFIQGEIDTGGN